MSLRMCVINTSTAHLTTAVKCIPHTSVHVAPDQKCFLLPLLFTLLVYMGKSFFFLHQAVRCHGFVNPCLCCCSLGRAILLCENATPVHKAVEEKEKLTLLPVECKKNVTGLQWCQAHLIPLGWMLDSSQTLLSISVRPHYCPCWCSDGWRGQISARVHHLM